MTNLEKTIERLRSDGNKFGIFLHPPASDQEIGDFERETKIKLPPDIIEFYKICNGFESDDVLFRVIPINEISKNRNNLIDNAFPIAEYLIYSDTWDVEIENDNKMAYQIVNYNHGTEDRKVMCDSLISFLNTYLNGTGVFGDSGLYS